jgi:Flp pilus assembly protein TadD
VKLYDRALDVTPNDPDILVGKATMYQAQGDLQEAARFLSEINWQTVSGSTIQFKLTQLRLERNCGEAVRLLRALQAQFHFTSDYEKAFDHVALAFMQRLAGDTADAKLTAEAARDTLEQRYEDQRDNVSLTANLSLVYVLAGRKDLALTLAERAIMLSPSTKDAMDGPEWEENLALIQTIAGENSRAISTLSRLLQTPYGGGFLSNAHYASPS